MSDLLSLTYSQIEERGQGQVYLRAVSKKTSTHTRIKLPDYAVAIIERYRGKRKTIFPAMTNAHLNRMLKLLFEQLAYTQPYPKVRMKRGVPVEIYRDALRKTSYRFCDLITSHTMRRTAITTMLILGMPEYVVRQISGHAANSKEFFRYVSVSQQYMDEESEKVFNKLVLD